jgi:hypothetical protein
VLLLVYTDVLELTTLGTARGSPAPSNAEEDEEEEDLFLDEVGEDGELRDQIRFAYFSQFLGLYND